MMTKHILFIVGSNRKGSFNQTAADFLAAEASKGAEVKFLDYSDVPFLSQDIEFPAPASVEAVRQDFKWADAIWLVTPEYNGLMPASLKNVLDWASRPVEQGVFGAPDFVKGKAVAVSGVAGASLASFARDNAVFLAQRMGMKVLENSVGLAVPGEAFVTGQFELNEEQKATLSKQVADFLAFI